MKRRCFSCRSQVTIFVIIALVIVGAIGGYFIIKNYYPTTIPANMAPVYDYYISCVKNVVRDGANTMASQGGYLESPEFYPGSEYAPFSSQLGFMGLGIPYWYYISGNGIKKEQIPTTSQMNEQLAKYLKEEVAEKCDLNSFIEGGYDIQVEDATSAKTSIKDNLISSSLSQKLIITQGDSTFTISNHKFEVSSNLGTFYNLAKKIYGYEKSSSFLENYSSDVLYTYAPVSGVVLNCSPTIWSPYTVIDTLKKALESNIGSVRMAGNYYTLKGDTRNYFVAGKDQKIDVKNAQISFLYSRDWPSRFEVWPTKNSLMTAEPIGTQAGLGVLGFCYAPYKFVYDMYFPVLVQIYNPDSAEEIFQFPMAVVINKNVPRDALPGDPIETTESLCDSDKKNSQLTINTYNVNLDPVEAEIEFKCLNSACGLGKTKIDNSTDLASITSAVPQCYNGILRARAQGYKEKKQIVSTNEETSVDVVLDREYKLGFEVYVDGKLTNDLSIVTLSEKNTEGTSESSSNFANIIYPANKEISLGEGDYNFDLRIYKNGVVNIPATKTRQCAEVPQSGLIGLFGLTEEKCSDITIPAQQLSNLLYSGGKVSQYITPTELENAKTLRVYAKSVKLPTSLDEIQSVYDTIESKSISISFA